MTIPSENGISKFTYKDNVIDIMIFADRSNFNFVLQNISESSIKIVWDEAVFVNFDASRNYHNVEDVVLYHSFDDLFSKLDNFIPHQANWDPRISSFEKDFLTYLSICMEKIAE